MKVTRPFSISFCSPPSFCLLRWFLPPVSRQLLILGQVRALTLSFFSLLFRAWLSVHLHAGSWSRFHHLSHDDAAQEGQLDRSRERKLTVSQSFLVLLCKGSSTPPPFPKKKPSFWLRLRFLSMCKLVPFSLVPFSSCGRLLRCFQFTSNKESLFRCMPVSQLQFLQVKVLSRWLS